MSLNSTPEDEQWQFTAGEIVCCSPRMFSGSKQGIGAVEKASDTIYRTKANDGADPFLMAILPDERLKRTVRGIGNFRQTNG